MVRQLQQELADALKKQSMSEASLEVTTRYRCELEEDKLRLQKELEKVNTKVLNVCNCMEKIWECLIKAGVNVVLKP